MKEGPQIERKKSRMSQRPNTILSRQIQMRRVEQVFQHRSSHNISGRVVQVSCVNGCRGKVKQRLTFSRIDRSRDIWVEMLTRPGWTSASVGQPLKTWCVFFFRTPRL